MQSVIAIVVLLVASAHAATTGLFGTQYACASSGSVDYSFALTQGTFTSAWSGSLDVSVTCSGSASGMWTFDIYQSASSWTQLAANGFSALSLDGSISATTKVGFKLTATAGTTVTATITTPDATLSVAFAQIIASITGQATAQIGFVQVDASGNTQVVIPATIQNIGAAGKALQATVTVTGGASTPTTDNYVISAISLSVPNVAFNTMFPITANANQTFVFTDAKTSVTLLAQASAQLQCQSSTTASTAPPATMGTFFKVFLTFDAYDQSGQATTFQGDATISYKYSAADLTAAGINANMASNLRFAYYDTNSMSWTTPSSGGSVDTSAMVVSQTTTHFSQWGVYAANAAFMNSANMLLVALAALVSYMLA